jgi:ATP-dependent phosphoenolpyruvate carboxykinase
MFEAGWQLSWLPQTPFHTESSRNTRGCMQAMCCIPYPAQPVSCNEAGRSPKDKRVVRDPASEGDVWWGGASPNIPMDERAFLLNRSRAVDYLNYLPAIFVFDGFANWDAEVRTHTRVRVW